MPNNSATGGFIQPAVVSPPLEGKALLTFFQSIVVGITGMDGSLVRPRWQTEPPNIPTEGTAWCAIGIGTRRSDTFPYVEHRDISQGGDYLQRQEELDVNASFYDQGVDGTADLFASMLRDGLAIAQNRETLQLQGYALAYSGELQPIPSLLKERWLYRVDLPFTIRRQIDRTYPVLDLLSATGTVYTDTPSHDPLERQIIVNPSE